jgi:hypothetical protein
MAETRSAAVDQAGSDDLISFLKAIPDGRYRGGVRCPQWFLLLVAVLGILSGCRSSRDLEAFARRHREALNQALGLNFKRWPSDATFLYLFNKAHLQEFGQVLQAWMISQIAGGPEGLDQLVCDGKTLRGSAVAAEDGSHRFVAQVTVYARALGIALAQTTYDTGESSERAALKELLSTLELEGVLIQADALHTTRPFFSGAWSRGRRAPDRQIEPEDPLPADRLPVPGKAPHPIYCKRSRETPRL